MGLGLVSVSVSVLSGLMLLVRLIEGGYVMRFGSVLSRSAVEDVSTVKRARRKGRGTYPFTE